MNKKNFSTYIHYLYPLMGLLMIGGIFFAIYQYQKANYTNLSKEYQRQISELKESLLNTQSDNAALLGMVEELNGKLSLSNQSLSQLTDNVKTYEKLRALDPELLKKYSKVYFLNENYAPRSLIEIDPSFVNPKDKVLQIHTDVWPHLEKLLQAANEQNLNLLVSSAYRSFTYQKTLKSQYTMIYGAQTANQFSAEQGYSEHQLGTTVDLTTPKLNGAIDSFVKTPEYTWLKEHAHEYGFVLSYPENNKYYKFEPWHWRYVGIDLATKLFTEQKYLYDLDQREIDGYLPSIF